MNLLETAILAALIILFNILYFIRVKARTKNLTGEILEEIKNHPEGVRIEPDLTSIRCDNKEYGKIKTNGIIFLSKKHIVFYYLMKKKKVEIPVSEIKKVTEADTFMNAQRKGKKVLIVHLKNGGEIGLFVTDYKQWKRELKVLNKKL